MKSSEKLVESEKGTKTM